jgi:hypothetical protein
LPAPWAIGTARHRTPITPRRRRRRRALAAHHFDRFVEELCAKFYNGGSPGGRPGLPPGVYFRCLLVGYFEGIDSERGIDWRCNDSNALKLFLGLAVDSRAGRQAECGQAAETERRAPPPVAGHAGAGPARYGFRTELWTPARVARVIFLRWGVSYHPSQVWRILRSMGWSCQKPERRARAGRGRGDAVAAGRLAAHQKKPRRPAASCSSSTRPA